MIVLMSPGPVRAVMVTNAVMSVPELVMNAFSPLTTHSPAASSRVAVVRVPPASLPASGSVSPKPPSVRPAQRSGSHVCFCSSVPKRWIGLAPEADPGLQRDRHRVVDPRQLLDRDAQHREIAAAAAVLLGERDPEQPEVAHAPNHVHREVVVAVPGLGVRRDLALGELAHHPTKRLVLLGELDVHGYDGLPGGRNGMDGLEPVPAGAKRDRTLPDVVGRPIRRRRGGADPARGGRRTAGHGPRRPHRRPRRARLAGLLGGGPALRRATGLRAVRQRPPGAPLARAAVGGPRAGCLDELAHRGRVHGRRASRSASRSRRATCTR